MLKLAYLSSADGPDVLHQLASLQLECSAALHLLIPQLHSPTLFGPANHTHTRMVCELMDLCSLLDPEGRWETHGRSLPPVTMSPSLSVVYMVKTGPLCAFATTRTRKCSLHT